ncbi:WecB/TagA/CpsF family glycosyltransferase [Alteromonas naphthalenivorans]|uniref:N-acetyl-mannosamine transferase n=1 Tax=Alteromonas naphthalenivorans TaxID=715451 RepID=F5ZD18_ALTNA|nr:WecB/TagA/CpsF family glycosyltransferase [Alteromonas naphthalenivorans]AEF03780.1 N-acetyl-mannosamine transferase [Alteromonas naphthalenivorans]
MDHCKPPIIEFDDVTIDAAANKITSMAESEKFDIVITPNVDHLSRLIGNRNPHLHSIYREASLTLCDSKIVEKLMRFKGKLIKNVIPGSTLTEHLFNNGHLNEKRVCIIGSDEEDIDKLRFLFPRVDILHINPSMGFINRPAEVDDIIQEVEEEQPEFIFLAVGSPRQEVLASKIKSRYNRGVGLCVGASILFLVGKEKRAPEIFQVLHLEWMYRALQRPRTLMMRYARNFLALMAIYSEL